MDATDNTATSRLIAELETVVERLREELGLGPSRLTDAADRLRADKEPDGG